MLDGPDTRRRRALQAGGDHRAGADRRPSAPSRGTALAAVPGGPPLLYARVDLIPGPDGDPVAGRAGADRAVAVPGRHADGRGRPARRRGHRRRSAGRLAAESSAGAVSGARRRRSTAARRVSVSAASRDGARAVSTRPTARPPAPGTRRACARRPATTGRWVKYCTKPIEPLAQHRSRPASATRRRATAPRHRAQREPRRHRQADQQDHQVGVQLGDHCAGLEPGAVGLLVAGVRAAAGDDGADDQHGRGDAERRSGRACAAGRGTVAPPGRRPRRARASSAYAAAMTPIESRKWQATTHGLRSVSTVMPPSTAWAGMPASTPRGQRDHAAGGAAAGAAALTSTTSGQDADDDGEHAVGELDRPRDPHGGGRDVGRRRCTWARSGSRGRSRSAGPRRRSPRSRRSRRATRTRSGGEQSAAYQSFMAAIVRNASALPLSPPPAPRPLPPPAPPAVPVAPKIAMIEDLSAAAEINKRPKALHHRRLGGAAESYGCRSDTNYRSCFSVSAAPRRAAPAMETARSQVMAAAGRWFVTRRQWGRAGGRGGRIAHGLPDLRSAPVAHRRSSAVATAAVEG